MSSVSRNRFREAVERHLEWKSLDAAIRETVWASVDTASKKSQVPLLNKRKLQNRLNGVTDRITNIQGERIHYCGFGCDEDTAIILDDLDKQEALAQSELTALRVIACVLEEPGY